MSSFAGRLLPVALVALAACAPKPAPNTSSKDAYADPRVCAACHQAIANTYKQTGMARAFRKASPTDAPDTPFLHKASGRKYQFEKRDGKLFLRREEEGGANALTKEIHYVLGSGNHARSYLHRTAQNRLIEMPVNWYPPNGGFLAMSPGYDRPDHMDMRRAVGYECMFCHNGYPRIPNAAATDDPVFPGTMPEGIDCQRCHGPGRAHVEAPGRGNILNPKSLPKPRQQEVCMQCHLEPTSYPLPNAIVRFERPIFSYDPKEPLADHVLHFDHAPNTGHDDKFEIASSAYRLRKSKCWQASNEQLTCTTCHNPHAVTKEFDAACQKCHKTLAASHTAKKDCATCHMPKRRTEDVIHVVVTDHKIQRPTKQNLLAARPEHHEQMGSTSYQGEVVLYHPKQLDSDLYPAIAQVAHQSNIRTGIPRLAAALEKQNPSHPAYYLQMAQAYHSAGEPAKAIPYYQKAIAKDAYYLPAIRSLGASQARINQLPEAQATLERATSLHPGDSLSWLELARVYRQQQKGREAAAAARKATELEPELVDAQVTLGMILLDSGDRQGAESAFRAALQEQPDQSDAHTNLGNLLTARGQLKEAEKHFGDAIRYNPKNAAARYNIAIFLANQRRFADAIPHAREAVALDTGNLTNRDLLGNLYSAARQWREAAATYRDALKINPVFPRAQLGLGTALGALNDFAGARIYLSLAAQSTDSAVRAEAMDLLRSLP